MTTTSVNDDQWITDLIRQAESQGYVYGHRDAQYKQTAPWPPYINSHKFALAMDCSPRPWDHEAIYDAMQRRLAES